MRLKEAVFLSVVFACRPSEPRADSRASAVQSSVSQRCDMVASERDTTCILFGPSLIELIARPDDYDEKRVRVIGFANLEFEGNALYVSREDFEHMITRNGVWLDVSAALAKPHAARLPGYFLVEGLFSAGHRGHMGLWSGAIERVTRFDASFSRADVDTIRRRASVR